MRTRIHVNQHVIRRNGKEADQGKHEPPLTVKDYKSNRKAFEAEIHDAAGFCVARIVYRPEKPLSCGARLWIETDYGVETF